MYKIFIVAPFDDMDEEETVPEKEVKEVDCSELDTATLYEKSVEDFKKYIYAKENEKLLEVERLLNKLQKTFKQKNAAYGNSFEECYKMFGESYSAAHLYEKVMRYVTLTEKPDLDTAGESKMDSLMDLANYALMTMAELKRSKTQAN